MIGWLFFNLLQVAIGLRQSLFRVPTAEEWGELYALAKKQALVGVCFVGCQRLPSEQRPPEMLWLQWLGMAAKIQQKNRFLNEECEAVTKLLEKDGLSCCVLKGQGNLVNYPDNLGFARTPGDIDVLMRSMEKADAIDLPIRYCITQCHKHNVPVGKICYHHMEMPWDGQTEVEAHHRASWLNSPLRNWRLQTWLEENMPFGVNGRVSEITQEGSTTMCAFPIPTVSFNAVYQLLHIYKHLFEEGIGLRQLLDYYFVLRNLPDSQHGEIACTLSRFGMKKFTGAVMWVLREVFDTPLNPPEGGKIKYAEWQTRWPWMICEPDEKEGSFLLNEIMQAGNFGKYDVRIKHGGTQYQHAWEKTKHNLRLLTHYPEEVIWEPFFRVYHWVWRRFELWRY